MGHIYMATPFVINIVAGQINTRLLYRSSASAANNSASTNPDGVNTCADISTNTNTSPDDRCTLSRKLVNGY